MTPLVIISIHAPLAGCDQSLVCPLGNHHGISIHAPLAGCDRQGVTFGMGMEISIHAPLAGCDPARRTMLSAQRISIHAPLAGCDEAPMANFQTNTNFNPRTPCGVRHYRLALLVIGR